MSNIESRVAKLESKVAVLENQDTHLSEDIKTLGDRINGMNDKKLTPMQIQLSEIHDSLHGSRGFIAGMTMAMGMIWAVMATFGVIIWNWFRA